MNHIYWPSTHRRAFTLVELMIAIAIIGVLTVSLVPVMSWYIYKAKLTAMKMDANKVENMLQIVMAEQWKRLIDITGFHCSDCYCKAEGFWSNQIPWYDGDVRYAGSGNLCYDKTYEMWNNIRNLSGFQFTVPLRDPWKWMYIIDENFWERPSNPCIADMLISAWPDNKRNGVWDITTPLEFPTTCP